VTDLPDADLWVALSVPAHPHHARAKGYWSTQGAADRAFCRTTWLALPRLLSEPRVFGSDALDGPAAWHILEQWMSRPEVRYLHEPDGIEELMRHWALSLDIRGGDWTGAYLAAFATANGCRVVSFDAGFARYPGLSWLHLEP
jgi:toxin-antitoxin system PIN domain toxin